MQDRKIEFFLQTGTGNGTVIPAKTLFFTVSALIAFAANSVLCRLALGEGAMDAASFTSIRLASGAAVLLAILKFRAPSSSDPVKGNWPAATMLFLYAMTFSFAYRSLDTGTGALILFGAVQLTMIFMSVWKGHRLHALEWVGVGLALFGFLYLMLPSVTTPSFLGFILMATAGKAWGIYTLLGKGSTDPLGDTTMNFARTIPFVAVVALLAIPTSSISWEGMVLAMLSGAVASGLGYTIWYVALNGLSAIEAAVVQLLVPVIAAAGGVLFVSEQLTVRLVMAGVLILGGILTVMLARYSGFQNKQEFKA